MIDINTILSLKEASTGSDFLRTASTVVGSIFVVGGVLSRLSFGSSRETQDTGVTIATVGLALIIIPQVGNKYKNKKWKYVIVNQ